MSAPPLTTDLLTGLKNRLGKAWSDWLVSVGTTITNLGTMATQNANNVAITGGTSNWTSMPTVASTAIIARGSNTNGAFVKFSDGTQICTGTVTLSNVSSSSGALFTSSNSPTWTFPSAFNAEPSVKGNDSSSVVIWVVCSTSTDSALVRGWCASSIATQRTIRLSAIGTWA